MRSFFEVVSIRIMGLLMASILILLSFNSCGPAVSVSTEWDRSVNFSAYRTYNWFQVEPVSNKDDKQYDTFLDKRIRSAIERELAAKGFIKTESNPDMLVAYEVKVELRQDVDYAYTYPYGPGYYYAPGFGYGYSYWYGYRYNYGFLYMPRTAIVRNYKEGSIIIDFVDSKRNELFWRGYGEATVEQRSIREERVNDIVREILEKYPPVPGDKNKGIK